MTDCPHRRLPFVLCFVVRLVVAVQSAVGFEGTEFNGGWLTGRLLSLLEIGSLLFLMALLATFIHLRIASGVGLAAAVLSLPLYFYLVFPVGFSQIFAFGHEFKVQPSSGFHENKWAITGLRALAATIFVCVRALAYNPRSWKRPISVSGS